jgi:phage-related protein
VKKWNAMMPQSPNDRAIALLKEIKLCQLATSYIQQMWKRWYAKFFSLKIMIRDEKYDNINNVAQIEIA